MGDCTLRLKKADELAGRDCRFCRYKMPRKAGLLRVLNFQSEIDESPDLDCWDYNGDYRPTLQRLRRLLGVPRMQILTRLPRSPRLSPEIAGIPDFAGREWVIACSDWKNRRGCRTGLPGLETAAQKCRDCRGCWECRIFSPRLPKVLAKIVESATEITGRHCRDCGDCWECPECRYF